MGHFKPSFHIRWKWVFMLIFLVSLVVVVLDQASKFWVLNQLKGQAPRQIFSWLQFEYLENRGAAFGILQGRFVLFLVITVLVIFLLVRIYRSEKKIVPRGRRQWLAVAEGMVIGGGLGNLIDRMGRQFVVDFIKVDLFGSWQFPIFNVADIGVTLGAVLMVIYFITRPDYEEKADQNSDIDREEKDHGSRDRQ